MKNITFFILAVLILPACKKDFLDRYPTDSINELNFWHNANELELYANNLYHNTPFFDGHGTYHTLSPLVTDDYQSDNLVPVTFDVVAAGQYVVPPDGGGWTWGVVRNCNYFLTRYGQTPIADEIKDRYAAEVRVFKALEYFRLVKRFGDVPWYSTDMQTNSEELYAPRDSRLLVMDSVLADLDWAIAHLPSQENVAQGRVNREIALAVKARITLHEGTFRKYHGISGSDRFLEEAFNSSKTLIDEGRFQIHNTGNPSLDYATLFNTLDLAGNREMILYRRYEENLVGTRTVQFIHDNAFNTGVSKSLMDTYLCDDGLPISLSPDFLGHDSIEAEMKNRDPRLLQTVVYPRTAMQAGFPAPAIPGTDFASSSLNAGVCPTGYQVLKYWRDDQEEYLRIQNGILDAPVIRYAEVLLIHAEAAAELNRGTQEVLDRTINLLRSRAGMPPMSLAAVESWAAQPEYTFDYPGINSALINEIRRERRVELAVEGYRYDDLMRWKAGSLLTQRLLGMKFVQSVYPGVEVGKDIFLDVDGFIWPYKSTLPGGRVFDETKHYYFPIPTQELVLNENLDQNENW